MKYCIFIILLFVHCMCLTHDEFCADPSRLAILGHELAERVGVNDSFWSARLFRSEMVKKMCAPLPSGMSGYDPIHALISLIGHMLMDIVHMALADFYDESYRVPKCVDMDNIVIGSAGWFMFYVVDGTQRLSAFSWAHPLSVLIIAICVVNFVVFHAAAFFVEELYTFWAMRESIHPEHMVKGTLEQLVLIAVCVLICFGCFVFSLYLIS